MSKERMSSFGGEVVSEIADDLERMLPSGTVISEQFVAAVAGGLPQRHYPRGVLAGISRGVMA